MNTFWQFQNYKLHNRSLLCQNFVTASSTQHVLEHIFKMSGCGMPLILTLFGNELPHQVLCWNLEYASVAILPINGYYQTVNESTMNSHWNMFWKALISYKLGHRWEITFAMVEGQLYHTVSAIHQSYINSIHLSIQSRLF